MNRKLQGNGMIVVPKTGHGERGLYQCKDGYVLKVNKKTLPKATWTREFNAFAKGFAQTTTKGCDITQSFY